MQYDLAGRRTSLADGTGTTAYSYDGLDRLVEAGHSLDGAVSYGYDLLGRRTSIATSTGAPAVTYDYDPAGRLEQVDRAGVAHASATYDALGRLATLSRANGPATAYSYDGVDRLVRLHTTAGSSVLSSFGYTMSRGSQVVLASETITANTRSIAYSYDGQQRLVGASEQPGSSHGYSYDLVGNRTQVVKDGVTVESHAYEAADQMVGRQYDAPGNLLSDGTSAYSYDALNRLYSLAQGGITTTFAYNGDGVLASETSGAVTTRYTLDTAGGQSERLGATTGSSTTWYVRGWGQELSSVSGGASSWYVADRLGSVRTLLDSTAGVTAGYNYDPFGTPQGSGSADYGFTGEPHHSAGGLVQLRARWYSTGSGRFLTQDPYKGMLEEPMSQAYYLYVYNDPINSVDPTGQYPADPNRDREGQACWQGSAWFNEWRGIWVCPSISWGNEPHYDLLDTSDPYTGLVFCLIPVGPGTVGDLNDIATLLFAYDFIRQEEVPYGSSAWNDAAVWAALPIGSRAAADAAGDIINAGRAYVRNADSKHFDELGRDPDRGDIFSESEAWTAFRFEEKLGRRLERRRNEVHGQQKAGD